GGARVLRCESRLVRRDRSLPRPVRPRGRPRRPRHHRRHLARGEPLLRALAHGRDRRLSIHPSQTERSRRKASILGAIAAAGAAALLLSSCSPSGSDNGGDGGDAPITLAYTATLSGDFASYGLEMREGVDLAIEEINAAGGVLGRQLTTVVQDDE